jgi:hypothetical protein
LRQDSMIGSQNTKMKLTYPICTKGGKFGVFFSNTWSRNFNC